MPKRSAKKQTSLILPSRPTGTLSIAELEGIITIARKFNVDQVQITSAKRLALTGFAEDDRAAIEALVNQHLPTTNSCAATGYIIACCGRRQCHHGCRQTAGVIAGLETLLADRSLPAKVKIGVSGCPRNCCASYTKDIGIFATMNGWTLLFGGNGGGKPRLAEVIATTLSEDGVLALAARCLDYYGRTGLPRERTARFIDRVGLAALQEQIITHQD